MNHRMLFFFLSIMSMQSLKPMDKSTEKVPLLERGDQKTAQKGAQGAAKSKDGWLDRFDDTFAAIPGFQGLYYPRAARITPQHTILIWDDGNRSTMREYNFDGSQAQSPRDIYNSRIILTDTGYVYHDSNNGNTQLCRYLAQSKMVIVDQADTMRNWVESFDACDSSSIVLTSSKDSNSKCVYLTYISTRASSNAFPPVLPFKRDQLKRFGVLEGGRFYVSTDQGTEFTQMNPKRPKRYEELDTIKVPNVMVKKIFRKVIKRSGKSDLMIAQLESITMDKKRVALIGSAIEGFLPIKDPADWYAEGSDLVVRQHGQKTIKLYDLNTQQERQSHDIDTHDDELLATDIRLEGTDCYFFKGGQKSPEFHRFDLRAK